MSLDYRVLLLAGLTILLWGFWGFFGKVALERNMAPRSVFLAEVFTSAVCAVAVVLNVYGVASGVGLALGRLLCFSSACITPPLGQLGSSRGRFVPIVPGQLADARGVGCDPRQHQMIGVEHHATTGRRLALLAPGR